MGVLTGSGGAVDAINTVRDWSISLTDDLQAYIASNTKSGTGRISGNEDWSGVFNAYGHTPVKMPGEKFTLTANIDKSLAGAALGAVGPVIVDQVEVRIDIESGAIIQHVTNFSGDGALVLGTAVADDVVVPNPPTSIGTKVQLAAPAASPTFTSIPDLRTATITFTRSNQPYVSSDTGGKVKRVAGNLDVALALAVFADNFVLADLPQVGQVMDVKVFVDATTFWQFQWMTFGELSDAQVDVENAAVVGATFNAMMNGYTLVGSTQTEGKIDKPGASTYWPFP